MYFIFIRIFRLISALIDVKCQWIVILRVQYYVNYVVDCSKKKTVIFVANVFTKVVGNDGFKG